MGVSSNDEAGGEHSNTGSDTTSRCSLPPHTRKTEQKNPLPYEVGKMLRVQIKTLVTSSEWDLKSRTYVMERENPLLQVCIPQYTHM